MDAKAAEDPKRAVEASARELGAVGGVVSVSEVRSNTAGETAIFSVTPATDP